MNKINLLPWRLLHALLFALTLTVSVVSCSDNGPDNPTDDKPSTAITQNLCDHVWEMTNMDFLNGTEWADLTIENIKLYFFDSESGVIYYSRKDWDTIDEYKHEIKAIAFDYEIYDNYLMLSDMEGQDIGTLKYSSAILNSLDNEPLLTPRDYTYNDYEWIKESDTKPGVCGVNLKYRYQPYSATLYIKGEGEMSDFAPKGAPWSKLLINHVKMDAEVTSVGNNAFRDMQIVDVTQFSDLKRIGDYAFSNTLISEIELPKTLEILGEGCFAGCRYLKTLKWEYNSAKEGHLRTIGAGAFSGTPLKLKTLTLPPHVKSIGDGAFLVTYITNLNLNEELESVGNTAFQGVASKVIIPNSMTSVGSIAFEGSFTEVRIGTGLKHVVGTPFSSTEARGKMYVNQTTPLPLKANILMAPAKWTLYVPKGCKAAYKSATGWKNFGNIVEDESLGG